MASAVSSINKKGMTNQAPDSAHATETATDPAPSIAKAPSNWRGVMTQLRLSTHDLDSVSTLSP